MVCKFIFLLVMGFRFNNVLYSAFIAEYNTIYFYLVMLFRSFRGVWFARGRDR
jgi:hypothetical protein